MRLLSKGGLYQLILLLPLIVFFSFLTKPVYAKLVSPCGSFNGTCVILHPGDYTTCTPSIDQCNPSSFGSQICNNGPSATNSGGCGTACKEGNAWTQYKPVCYVSGMSSYGIADCNYGIVRNQNVCSTADKYQPNTTYPSGSSSVLDYGSCSCAIGSPYKVCCALDPSTGVYSEPVSGVPSCPEGSGVCPTPFPYDGSCPSFANVNGQTEPVLAPTSGVTTCQAPASYTISIASSPVSGVNITTPWGSVSTSFSKTFTSPNPFSLTAQSSVNSGGQYYSFYNWEYTDGAYRQYSTSTTTTLTPDPSYLNISAIANYQGAQKYYYCKTSATPNSCTQTSNVYANLQDCENALQQNLPGQTTGKCYASSSACSSACGTQPPTPAYYYYCKTSVTPNACTQTSNTYISAQACQAALQQHLSGQTTGKCYASSSACTTSCGTTTPPSGGSGNIAINISASGACLPQGGTNNSTNLSWSISGPSCPAGQTLSSGSTQLSCSSNIPGGPTGSGSGGSSVSVNQTTNFGISCSYNTFTCSYPCNPTTEVTTTPSGATTTITIWQTCFNAVNGGSASKSTTVYYIQPPNIYSFAPNPQNILINKATTLSWAFQVPDSGTPTGQYCYPSGGNGDLSGWSSGQQYQSYQLQTGNLYPKQNTTYNITCRNYATGYSNCYNESAGNTNVNVYQSNLRESNPAALIESAFGGFLKKLGI